jgi:hypothetical protein
MTVSRPPSKLRPTCWAPVAVLALVWACGCGAAGPRHTASTKLYPGPGSALTADGPAFGLTEDNADLLWNAGVQSGPARFLSARRELTALHPTYLRLLVDWAALQPDPDRPPALEAHVSGCAREVGPCGAYASIRAELDAIAGQQRVAVRRLEGDGVDGGRTVADGGTANGAVGGTGNGAVGGTGNGAVGGTGNGAVGGGDFNVVIDIFGVPAWAAVSPSGCEFAGTTPFSRPLRPAAISGYRALIHSLLALAARAGVALEWWSPWNEPNNPLFISPQHASCAADSPTASPAVYSQLARAMAAELNGNGGVHHMLLGELDDYRTDSPHRTSIASFVASLPADVICLADAWSVHDYAARGASSSSADPVAALESALDPRGACAREAPIWVTEAGAGAPRPGFPRPAGATDERAGCEALAVQLARWHGDPRVQAVFQYTFREDPAFPVGLLSANLSHLYPTYDLWLDWSRLRAAGQPPPAPSACA